MTDRTPLIAGNWKMNLDHFQSIALIQKLAWTLNEKGHDFKDVEVAVFPPFTALRSAQTLIDAEKFELSIGAQDISRHTAGAFTGEVSAAMLSKLNVKYVLVGHSERRQYHNETDELVQQKVASCFSANLTPVICVGETQAELEQHGPSAVPVRQALAALQGHESLKDFVIAYEPVWAIGTGEVATPEQAEEVALKIRQAIHEAHGELAEQVRVLYGGSVKAANVAGFMQGPNIDGVLVGGASLDSDEFAGIARYKKHIVL
jgi:triosephosphate isomerase (TIM)